MVVLIKMGLILFLSSGAFAAKLLVYKGENGDQLKLYLEKAKLRLDINDKSKNDQQSIVFLEQKKITYMIDHGKKEFISLDEKKLKQMGQMIDSAMAMMQNLPPAMQKQIQAQMGKNKPQKKQDKYKFVKKASGLKVKKWTTDKYAVLKGNKLKSEIWSTPFNSVDMSSSDLKVFDSLVKFYTSSSKHLGKFVGNQSITAFFDRKAVNGLPVKVKSHDKNKKVYFLESITSGSKISFAVPQGYVEKKMM